MRKTERGEKFPFWNTGRGRCALPAFKAMKHSKPAFASLLLTHSRFTTCFSFTQAAQASQEAASCCQDFNAIRKGEQPLHSISKLNRKHCAQGGAGRWPRLLLWTHCCLLRCYSLHYRITGKNGLQKSKPGGPHQIQNTVLALPAFGGGGRFSLASEQAA